MNRNPLSSKASRFAADSIPASATTTMSCAWWRSRNRVRTGIRVLVSALLPSNRSTSSGNPVAVVSSPTVTCGSTVFLAHPDLAQLVLTFDLEVQRCHVVEHDRQARGPGGVPVTGLRDHAPVVPLDHALEAAHERHPMRGRDTDFGQDADGVQLAGRLDHPGQDQRPERLIAETIQAEGVVDTGQDLPQD